MILPVRSYNVCVKLNLQRNTETAAVQLKLGQRSKGAVGTGHPKTKVSLVTEMYLFQRHSRTLIFTMLESVRPDFRALESRVRSGGVESRSGGVESRSGGVRRFSVGVRVENQS